MKWHELTSPEIAALVTSDPVAILPIAAIEQHGPHLPLSTDVDIGDGLIDAAAVRLENVPFVVLPTQTIGSSPEHVAFPGTLTLSADSLEEALVGQEPSATLFSKAADILVADAAPKDGNAFKVPLARRTLIATLKELTGVQQ